MVLMYLSKFSGTIGALVKFQIFPVDAVVVGDIGLLSVTTCQWEITPSMAPNAMG